MDASADRALTPFEEQALAIAAEYTAWGRVDDELRWAPFLCRQPYPGITRVSQSNDEATHGRKLYSVFAKNHDTYPNGPHDGQVVVKQSWIPELVPDADAGLRPIHYATDAGINADHFYPYAQGDGGVYRAGAPAGLLHHVQARSRDARHRRGLGLRDGLARRPGHRRGPRRQLHGLPRDQRDARAPLRRPAQPVVPVTPVPRYVGALGRPMHRYFTCDQGVAAPRCAR